MPGSQDRHLISQMVTRGILSPAQANQALRAARSAEESNQPFVLRMFLTQKRFISPKRFDEFVQALQAPAPQPEPAPTPKKEEKPDEFPLPFEIAGFRLVQKLGAGGMGAVYKALQIQMRRYVAVKILPKKFAEDPMYVERFRREARAAAALNHPNIVLPISVGEDMGFHYLSMEFVDGESLGGWMEREGRLRWKEAVEIAIQVARGLEHAHKHKLIHRDIKPDNILLDRPSHLAKIVNLGLARRTTDRSDITSATGNPVGTAYYVSPEQARGEGNLDGRTDIYSLGASLWHMLVGVPPFDGPNAAVILTKHITEPVPDPRTSVSDCPEGLVQLILKMMAKKREDRYDDCTQLCEDMQSLLDGRRPRHAFAGRGAGAARGAPLVVPTGGLAPGGARLRDPSSSRLRDPTTSRLRGPTASRVRGPGTSRAPEPIGPREASPFQSQKAPSPWLNIVILAGLLLVCLILIIVLAQRKAEQPPPNEPKTESVKR